MLSRKAFVLLFLMCYSKLWIKKSPLNGQVCLSYHLLCLPSDIPVSASSTGLPTVKKHTSSSSPKRDAEQRCTDTRIHLDVASDAEPGNTYGRTLSLEWSSPPGSEKEAETRSSSRSRKKQTKQNPPLVMWGTDSQLLVCTWRSSAFMPPYDDSRTCYAKLLFPPSVLSSQACEDPYRCFFSFSLW